MSKRKLLINVYGSPKSGKSSLGGTCPTPSMCLDVEGRSDFSSTADLEVRRVFGYKDTLKEIKELQKGDHDFKSVRLDSTTALSDNMMDDIAGDKKPEWDDWGQLKRQVGRLSKQLRDLIDTTTIDVVYLITPMREFADPKSPDPRNPEYIKGLDLQGAFRNKILYIADITACMEVKVSRRGEVTRTLICGPKRGYVTGHAFGEVNPDFPDEIENPTVPKILDLIYGVEND